MNSGGVASPSEETVPSPISNNPEEAVADVISPTNNDTNLLESGLPDKDVTSRCDDCDVSLLSYESVAMPPKRGRIWMVAAVMVVLLCAVTVTGVCGSGVCRRGTSRVSTTAADVDHACNCHPVASPVSEPTTSPMQPQTTVTPSAAPTAVIPPRRAFTTTQELYDAVDEYLLTGAAPNPDYGHPIGVWNISLLNNLSRVFDAVHRNPRAYDFNENLTGWDTARVVTMEQLFLDARSFDGDVSTWNTGRVVSMRETFGRATSFRGDVSQWDVSRVTTMERMCT